MSAADQLAWMDMLKEKYGIACPVTYEDDGDDGADCE